MLLVSAADTKLTQVLTSKPSRRVEAKTAESRRQ